MWQIIMALIFLRKYMRNALLSLQPLSKHTPRCLSLSLSYTLSLPLMPSHPLFSCSNLHTRLRLACFWLLRSLLLSLSPLLTPFPFYPTSIFLLLFLYSSTPSFSPPPLQQAQPLFLSTTLSPSCSNSPRLSSSHSLPPSVYACL